MSMMTHEVMWVEGIMSDILGLQGTVHGSKQYIYGQTKSLQEQNINGVFDQKQPLPIKK
jgi:hypothetical protein